MAGAENGAQRGVYRLDAIARTKPIRFELRGKLWSISADPDVEVVATMLRLERELTNVDADGAGDVAGMELADAVVEAKDLVLDLIDDWPNQDQPLERGQFRISVTELLSLFGLMTGSPSVADAVAQGITSAMSTARGQEDFSDSDDEEDGPLASTTRSSGRRSSSAASTSGRRRGGRG
jgi:hypothetical protein